MGPSIDLSFNEIKRVRLMDSVKDQTDSPQQLNKFRSQLTKNFNSEVKLPARIASKRYQYNFSVDFDAQNPNKNIPGSFEHPSYAQINHMY